LLSGDSEGLKPEGCDRSSIWSKIQKSLHVNGRIFIFH
jgi:hypothetical protein